MGFDSFVVDYSRAIGQAIGEGYAQAIQCWLITFSLAVAAAAGVSMPVVIWFARRRWEIRVGRWRAAAVTAGMVVLSIVSLWLSLWLTGALELGTMIACVVLAILTLPVLALTFRTSARRTPIAWLCAVGTQIVVGAALACGAL